MRSPPTDLVPKSYHYYPPLRLQIQHDPGAYHRPEIGAPRRCPQRLRGRLVRARKQRQFHYNCASPTGIPFHPGILLEWLGGFISYANGEYKECTGDLSSSQDSEGNL